MLFFRTMSLLLQTLSVQDINQKDNEVGIVLTFIVDKLLPLFNLA